jgi:hypothetical protein
MWLMEQVKSYVDGIEEHLLQDWAKRSKKKITNKSSNK